MNIEKPDLFQFVKEKTFVNDIDINMETRLEDDLGVYGDDAVEFIIAYGKYYNVNISNFMAADYFNGEGLNVLNSLIGIFKKEKKASKKALTVGHLYKAILAGRLDEEVINS
ncbi:DUF1493 family protein [Pedobacter sp. MC2016-24]|uniref:DUF1493 family protein n=1 Tax=Pedobacter sp. MC2016-24 TaxID=2780090 RepID=UPI00188204CF|nr:DUF1493 family protein [Pedobacter sp. MC2016-24]MBE9599489.1 DUF1493 family protein [Pedobacter sp. MC2016-24]